MLCLAENTKGTLTELCENAVVAAAYHVDSAFVSALRVLDDLIAHLLRGKPLEAIHLGLYIARAVEEAAFDAGIELFFHLLVHLFERQSARYRIESASLITLVFSSGLVMAAFFLAEGFV